MVVARLHSWNCISIIIDIEFEDEDEIEGGTDIMFQWIYDFKEGRHEK